MSKLNPLETSEPKLLEAEKPDYRDAYTLHYLHWEENLNTRKMSELLGVSHTTVWKWLKKQGISIKSMSEALEKYPKKPFPDDPVKKAYGFGLRAGDVDAGRHGRNIMFSITTTHHAMLNLMQNFFGRCGHYHEYPVLNKKTNQYEFRSYSLVHGESSSFMLEKPTEIPKNLLFYSFLAGYADSDGNWTISYSNKNKTLLFMFQLCTEDTKLLKQIKGRPAEDGFHPNFRLVRKAGYVNRAGVRSTKDSYGVFLTRRNEVVRLAKKLLSYSWHNEKIAWMRLILEVKDEEFWVDVKDRVNRLREKINRETEARAKEAEEKYKASHGGGD